MGWGSGRKHSWVFYLIAVEKARKAVVVPQQQNDGDDRHNREEAEECKRNARPKRSALGRPRARRVKPSVEIGGQKTITGSERCEERSYPKKPQFRARGKQGCFSRAACLAPHFPASISFRDSSPLSCADETSDEDAKGCAVGKIPREKREREPSNRKVEMSGDPVLAVTTEGVAKGGDCEQRKSPRTVQLGNLPRGRMHSRPPT